MSSSPFSPQQPVVKLIEEASSRGLKEVRFITLQNQYILNIREGFQQNAVFGFRRQIKKRPMFMSSVLLTPHLQWVETYFMWTVTVLLGVVAESRALDVNTPEFAFLTVVSTYVERWQCQLLRKCSCPSSWLTYNHIIASICKIRPFHQPRFGPFVLLCYKKNQMNKLSSNRLGFVSEVG